MGEDCRDALHELGRYLDDECGADLEQTIRQHLGDCPPCLDRADFERELRAIVASRCKDAAPSGLLDRIIADLRPGA
jgi:anti-sigma factor (TIGR02949 family)